MLSGNFYGSEIRHGIFWGLNFGPGIFLGFDFCPHWITLWLEIRSTPPGSGKNREKFSYGARIWYRTQAFLLFRT